jgi:hypothetical protein
MLSINICIHFRIGAVDRAYLATLFVVPGTYPYNNSAHDFLLVAVYHAHVFCPILWKALNH